MTSGDLSTVFNPSHDPAYCAHDKANKVLAHYKITLCPGWILPLDLPGSDLSWDPKGCSQVWILTWKAGTVAEKSWKNRWKLISDCLPLGMTYFHWFWISDSISQWFTASTYPCYSIYRWYYYRSWRLFLRQCSKNIFIHYSIDTYYNIIVYITPFFENTETSINKVRRITVTTTKNLI